MTAPFYSRHSQGLGTEPDCLKDFRIPYKKQLSVGTLLHSGSAEHSIMAWRVSQGRIVYLWALKASASPQAAMVSVLQKQMVPLEVVPGEACVPA